MPDFKIEITIKDVAKGDIETFCDDIIDAHGHSFDYDQGDFEVRALEQAGENVWVEVDLTLSDC